MYCEAYACGQVVIPACLNGIIVQAWQHPFTMDLMNAMLGIQQGQMKEDEPPSSHLKYTEVPDEYHGKTFGELFRDLAMKNGIIAIGLLRSSIGLDNQRPYVYTNPIVSTILFPTDKVYMLAFNTKQDALSPSQ